MDFGGGEDVGDPILNLVCLNVMGFKGSTTQLNAVTAAPASEYHRLML